MEWAKPDAHIAFVLHARLLFKQSEPGRASREELLAALHVTGLLNGAALRMSRFWPDVTAPFCLLFARNRVPPADAAFWYVNPELEGHLNAHGKWRIDDATARRIAPADVAAVPSLLKTLFRGTELDAQLIRRISQHKLVALQDYWQASGGKDHHGQGFKVGGAGPTTRRKQIDATELWGMHKLEGKRPTTRRIDVASLPKIPKGHEVPAPAQGDDLPGAAGDRAGDADVEARGAERVSGAAGRRVPPVVPRVQLRVAPAAGAAGALHLFAV
jgi:hypothetical protein